MPQYTGLSFTVPPSYRIVTTPGPNPSALVTIPVLPPRTMVHFDATVGGFSGVGTVKLFSQRFAPGTGATTSIVQFPGFGSFPPTFLPADQLRFALRKLLFMVRRE